MSDEAQREIDLIAANLSRNETIRKAFVTIQEWLLDIEDHVTEEAQEALNLQAYVASQWLKTNCVCGVNPERDEHTEHCPIWDMELA